MSEILTVISFTYRNKIRSRAFAVTAVILALIISVAINLPYIISRLSSNQPTKVAMIASQTGIAPMLEQYYKLQKKPAISIVLLPDKGSQTANDQELKDAVQAKKAKGFLELGVASTNGDFPAVIYRTPDSIMASGKVTSDLRVGLQSIKTQLAVQKIGLTSQQLANLYAPVSISSVQFATGGSQHGKTANQAVMATVLVYALLILLFTGVTTSGNMIANEVTAEKSSRVMEILISTITPLKQMFGKIIGVALVALTQIAVYVVVAAINLSMPQNTNFLKQNHLSLHDIPMSLVIYFIVFYVLGFFLYATVFAAIGSLVSRTEDLGQAVMPVTFLLLGGFYIGIYGMQAPTSPVIVGLSYVPFFTPLLMFLRLGLSDVPSWQMWLGLADLVLSVYAMTWLSAKIYRTGVLMYGKRPSIRELVKAMRAMKV